TSRISSRVTGLPALAKIANWRRAGTTSRKSSSRLPARSVCWNDKPVTLPPITTKPVPDGSPPRENNRNNRCRLLCCENTYGPRGNNDIDFVLDELGNDLGCALAASIRPSNLDRDGVTLDPAGCTQPLHESGDPLVLNRSRHWAQEPDGRQL